jgi:hypothetical protein
LGGRSVVISRPLPPTPPFAIGDLGRFSPTSAGNETLDHAALGRLLSRYVHAGSDTVNRVDYRAWKMSDQDVAALLAYLSDLQAQDPQTLTHAEQFAYWANLYNAETLRLILNAYPVSSILWVRPRPFALSVGPWNQPTLRVAGQSLSLNQVENAVLRPLFGDSRVHYALNCASISCPNLNRIPWRGASLGIHLDAAAVAYVNHSRAMRADNEGLKLSTIYKWYRADFGGKDVCVLAHLWRYARGVSKMMLAPGVRIAGYRYDWALNDTAGAPKSTS